MDPQYKAQSTEPLFTLKVPLEWWYMKLPPTSSILACMVLNLSLTWLKSQLSSKSTHYFYYFSLLISYHTHSLLGDGSGLSFWWWGKGVWGIFFRLTLVVYSNIFLFQHLQKISWIQKFCQASESLNLNPQPLQIIYHLVCLRNCPNHTFF